MLRITRTREWGRALTLIRSSRDILVGTHVRPDGDALGSSLALSLALAKLGARVACLAPDPVPAIYRFLPGADGIGATPPPWRGRLGIAVDCDGPGRLGPLESAFTTLPHLIDIDHHGGGRAFGDVALVDPGAGAAAEIVFDLARSLGIAPDADMAVCLYTAILTDSGRFSYGNTTARSLGIAAELVEAGAQPELIARRVYAERSLESTRLLGVALTRLRADLDGKAVSSALARSDFGATGAAPADTEGIIDQLRAIGGPRVAMLFVEVGDDQVRVSLRSDGSVDVSAVAREFEGGGHAAAAGCTCQGSTQEVRGRVLAAVQKILPADRTDGG